MLIQFKDLKQGDIIARDNILFACASPKAHIFKNETVITVKAKFIERRKIALSALIDKRENYDFDLKHGLNLQGFSDDTIEVFEHNFFKSTV